MPANTESRPMPMPVPEQSEQQGRHEQRESRQEVLQAFTRAYDRFQQADENSLTPQERSARGRIRTAKEQTLDQGRDTQTVTIPSLDGSQNFVRQEGVPVGELIAYLRRQQDQNAGLTQEQRQQISEEINILSSPRNSRTYEQAGESIGSYTARVAHEVNQIANDPLLRSTADNENRRRADNYFAAAQRMENFRELVLPQEGQPQQNQPENRPPENQPQNQPNHEQNNNPDNNNHHPSSRTDFRREIVVAGRTKDRWQRAREQADAQVEEDILSTKRGWNRLRLFRTINISWFKETRRQVYTQRAMEQMARVESSYADISFARRAATVVNENRADEQASGKAKIEEVKLREREGLLRPEEKVVTVNGGLKEAMFRDILRPMVQGQNLDRAEVQRRLRDFVASHRNDNDVIAVFGAVANAGTGRELTDYFATDLIETASVIREDLAANRYALEALEENVALKFADVRWAAQSEASLSLVDRIMEKSQTWPHGLLRNPIALAAITDLTIQVPTRIAASLAKNPIVSVVGAWGSLGAGAVVAGGFSFYRRRQELTMSRATHQREQAYQLGSSQTDKLRNELNRYSLDIASVQSLRDGNTPDYAGRTRSSIESLLRASDNQVNQNREEYFRRIAEIRERLDFSVTQKVDLISFKGAHNVEQGRLQLLKDSVELRRALERAGVADIDTHIREERQRWEQHFTTDREQQDRSFRNYRTRQSWKAAGISAVTSIVGGQLVGEVGALAARAAHVGEINWGWFKFDLKSQTLGEKVISQVGKVTTHNPNFEFEPLMPPPPPPESGVQVLQELLQHRNQDLTLPDGLKVRIDAQNHLLFDNLPRGVTQPDIFYDQVHKTLELAHGDPTSDLELSDALKKLGFQVNVEPGLPTNILNSMESNPLQPVSIDGHTYYVPSPDHFHFPKTITGDHFTIHVDNGAPAEYRGDHVFDIVHNRDGSISIKAASDTDSLRHVFGTGKLPPDTGAQLKHFDGINPQELIDSQNPAYEVEPGSYGVQEYHNFTDFVNFTENNGYGMPQYAGNELYGHWGNGFNYEGPNNTPHWFTAKGSLSYGKLITSATVSPESGHFDPSGLKDTKFGMDSRLLALENDGFTKAQAQEIINQYLKPEYNPQIQHLLDVNKNILVQTPDGLALPPKDMVAIVHVQGGKTLWLPYSPRMVGGKEVWAAWLPDDLQTPQGTPNANVQSIEWGWATKPDGNIVNAGQFMAGNHNSPSGLVFQQFASTSVHDEGLATVNLTVEKQVDLTLPNIPPAEHLDYGPVVLHTPWAPRRALERPVRSPEYTPYYEGSFPEGARLRDVFTYETRRNPFSGQYSEADWQLVDRAESARSLEDAKDAFDKTDHIYVVFGNAIGDATITTGYVNAIREAMRTKGKNVPITLLVSRGQQYTLFKELAAKYGLDIQEKENGRGLPTAKSLSSASGANNPLIFSFEHYSPDSPGIQVEQSNGREVTTLDNLLSPAIQLYNNTTDGRKRYANFIADLLSIPPESLDLDKVKIETVLPANQDAIFDRIKNKFHVDMSKPQVGVLLETSIVGKRYSVDNWLATATDMLRSNPNLQFNFVYFPGTTLPGYNETDIRNAIARAGLTSQVNLVEGSLQDMTVFLSRNKVVMGCDTGLGHAVGGLQDGPKVVTVFNNNFPPHHWVSNTNQIPVSLPADVWNGLTSAQKEQHQADERVKAINLIPPHEVAQAALGAMRP